ncbi:Glycosyltransferase involved in cell wall bisynthesis [Lentibacillus persicus]|uniref:Glycosyltransferase involved in cell wall bisynthesis n=1 Tax=Lentibacillus persicus TaxID=640948 RepID=A0A1I1U809_9BACI|nr:glycosyltransferase [Lentibacillus persicus]SFD66996.1 Glycosyltransferase involved in cell wall bisynthesis [Lentibacillus persicus]
MKKSILFVIDSLDVAGAEKSLVTLLNLMDYSKYDVDLQLFAHGNLLEKLVPEEVNILEPLKYTAFSKLGLPSAVAHSFAQLQLHMLSSRLRYSFRIRRNQCSNPQKARIYWESAANVIEQNNKAYDIAISYAQGVPTFYVAAKVNAKRKIAWVNVSYRLDEYEQTFQKHYYNHYDKIIAVSDSAKEVLAETFPAYKDKLAIQYDINNPNFISEMAELGEGYEDSFDGIRILTIGRLARQKGYDIALDACKRLKDEGVHFKWYVLGKGPLQAEIEQSIKAKGLTEHFILLGVKANPYPLIKNATVYVQTSRFEGYGIAIAEARMLNTPVVTAKFDAVYNQMVDGKNGLVVERNALDVSEGIKRIVQNEELRHSIIDYLTHEKKGNVEEMNGFYELINSS